VGSFIQSVGSIPYSTRGSKAAFFTASFVRGASKIHKFFFITSAPFRGKSIVLCYDFVARQTVVDHENERRRIS